MTRIEAQRDYLLEWCNDLEYQLVAIRNEDLARNDIFIQELICELDQCNKCLRDYLQTIKTLTDPKDIEREVKFLKSTLKRNRIDWDLTK